MSASEVLNAMYQNTPLIFAHSGAQAYAPSNTMPAFELAVSQGADGIELDVHCSADGHAVVLHDFTIEIAPETRARVADLTLSQLKALDVGSKFSPTFAGAQIPTLDEVFEAVGQPLLINVEIKSHSAETDGVEEVVAACITRHAMQARVLVSSFNPLCLKRFRALLPHVPIGFLHGKDSPSVVHSLLDGLAYEAYHPQDSLVDEQVMARAREAGHIVNVWTVNDTARGVELRDLGVHGIITDAPDQMLLHTRR